MDGIGEQSRCRAVANERLVRRNHLRHVLRAELWGPVVVQEAVALPLHVCRARKQISEWKPRNALSQHLSQCGTPPHARRSARTSDLRVHARGHVSLPAQDLLRHRDVGVRLVRGRGHGKIRLALPGHPLVPRDKRADAWGAASAARRARSGTRPQRRRARRAPRTAKLANGRVLRRRGLRVRRPRVVVDVVYVADMVVVRGAACARTSITKQTSIRHQSVSQPDATAHAAAWRPRAARRRTRVRVNEPDRVQLPRVLHDRTRVEHADAVALRVVRLARRSHAPLWSRAHLVERHPLHDARVVSAPQHHRVKIGHEQRHRLGLHA